MVSVSLGCPKACLKAPLSGAFFLATSGPYKQAADHPEPRPYEVTNPPGCAVSLFLQVPRGRLDRLQIACDTETVHPGARTASTSAWLT